MRFYEWLRSKKDSEKTFSKMSKDLNLSISTIEKNIRGVTFPREETFYLYCHYFNVKDCAKLYESFRREEDKLRHRWGRDE